ncbi:TonB-dependent receptor [Asticcacaulis solisilvae]|uniref:TonB-dependent receptor n=1 Tax=Asticcacaulis solisilvae TaxID=1217274 RepID=UPI003FD7B2A4
MVTGFRKSVAKATDLKRHANGFQDSILAEDIAKFPDTNIAESLQRVPGVAISRDGGEGRQVSIHGMSADWTQVRLNGMEALATTTSIDSRGGVNRGRAFDFNIFASELFNRVDVVKSTAASVEEGGVAGTVDLHTPHPFDYKNLTFAVSAQAATTSHTSKADPRMALLFANRTADGRFGFLLSAAYSKSNIVEDGYSDVRWAQGGWNTALASSSIDPSIVARLNTKGKDALFYPRYDRYDIFAYHKERTGLTASFQYKVSDDLELGLDLMAGRLRNNREEYHLDAAAFSATSSTNVMTINSLKVAGNDIVAGSFGNVYLRSDSHIDRNRTDFTQGLLNARWHATSTLDVTASLGREESNFKNPIQNNIFLRTPSTVTMTYDFAQSDRVPVQTYSVDTSNPSSFYLWRARRRSDYVDDVLTQAKADAVWRASDDIKVKFGLNRSTQSYDSTGYGANDDVTYPTGTSLTGLTETLPYKFGKDLGVSGLPTGWVVTNLQSAWSQLPTTPAYTQTVTTGSVYTIRETLSGAYAEAEFRTQLLGRTLRGDAGLRYADTIEDSSGLDATGTSTVAARSHYFDWLPSLNLVWEVRDDVNLRFAANRNLTRPTLSSLVLNPSVNSSARQASSGNVNLKPFRANTYQAGAEWYFDKTGVLALNVFHLDIDSFIVSTSVTQTWRASGLPTSLLPASQVSSLIDEAWVFTRPVNGKGAKLNGLELQYNQDMTFLPAPFDKMGYLLNYTYADSTTHQSIPWVDGTSTDTVLPLPGLSKNSYNATLYYETPKWGARLAANYRSKYITSVPGGNYNDVAGVNESFNLDASAHYNLSRHLTLTFEALNLTNQADDEYVNSTNRVYNYTKSGQQFLAGLRYTY